MTSGPIRRILVGVDGSEHARRAVGWAGDLAGALGAEVVAVYVMGLLAHPDAGPAVPAESHRAELEATLRDEWCRPLRERGVAFRAELLDGTPPLALQQAAETEDVDLIVVGARGIGGAPALLLGSTSHQLAQLSDRPVVIIPPERPTA